MSIILHYLNLNNRSLNVNCDVFRAAALDTWHRISFSRTKPGLKIHETTVTQNLVYELNFLQQVFPNLGYKIYESKNESTNGDDLEISVRILNGNYITFAVQAKIIYHNLVADKTKLIKLNDGAYKQMQHYVGKSMINQVDLLLSFAKKSGAIPLYLLYNFVTNSFPLKNWCGIDFNISQYGCSIVSAQYLKNNHSISDGNLSDKVKFSDLHPTRALPWFVIPCCFSTYSTEQVLSSLQYQPSDYEIGELPEKLTVDLEQWRLLGNIEELYKVEVSDSEIISEEIETFNPKFKLLVG